MTKIINLCDNLYTGEYIEEDGEKISIPLRELIKLSLKHNLTDANLEINFYDDYYDGLRFESINMVGEELNEENT